MKPVDEAVLVVLLVLLTAAQSLSPLRTTEPTTIETTIETTPVPITTVCPTITCDDPNCFLENGPDGCPAQCICGDPICMFVTCPPGEQCVPNDECPDGKCYSCVSIYGISPSMSAVPSTTTSCMIPSCAGDCVYETGSNGCLRCFCPHNCQSSMQCRPDEECVSSDEFPSGFACVRKYGTTTETTTGTTITNCPMVSACGLYCTRTTGADGCSDCDCSTPCEFATCPPDEQCVPNSECHGIMDQETCYSCVSIHGTTTETPTGTTTPVCPDVSSCNESMYCYLDYTYLNTVGCPTCICWVKTTTQTPTPYLGCAIVDCFTIGCRTVPGPDGCDTCDCSTYNCDNVTCDPDQYCVMQDVVDCYYPWCPPEPNCVPYDTTTETTTWPTKRPPTPTVCPDMSSCIGDCRLEFSSGECPSCLCIHSICWSVTCPPGEQCVPNEGCPGGVCHSCVSMHETTTSCPMFTCAPDCVPGNGPDGCPTCECPPSCQTVKCSDGYECQLVNVTCFRYPCFPQPQCVPTENPCTGTPNPRRCGRFRNRWTYNSVTNTCEKFKYYGCTPSLNTFLSPKACKNKCKGGAQTICEDVVCENNCSTYTRKNECPKCICPNPCKGFKCREGYECKLRDAKCEDKDPKPFCARK